MLEPTRNAWLPLAAWSRRRGATVVLVPAEQSADLRASYANHPKTDRLDAELLARLPLLHPDGLHQRPPTGPVIRSGGPWSSDLGWCVGAVPACSAWTPCWRSSARTGWPPWARTCPKRPSSSWPAGSTPIRPRRLGRARLARWFPRQTPKAWANDEPTPSSPPPRPPWPCGTRWPGRPGPGRRHHRASPTRSAARPTTATPACARRCSWPPTTPARPTHPGRPLPAAQVPDRPPPHPWALGTIATVLCTRIVACLRNNTPYQIRDVDGSPITPAQSRAIVAERYQIPPQVVPPAERSATSPATNTDGTSASTKKSPSAPRCRPSHRQPQPSPPP